MSLSKNMYRTIICTSDNNENYIKFISKLDDADKTETGESIKANRKASKVRIRITYSNLSDSFKDNASQLEYINEIEIHGTIVNRSTPHKAQEIEILNFGERL